MSRLQIELSELNKLYDEIYYGNFKNVEVALDIVSNIISEKEFECEEEFIFGLSSIIEIIVGVLDEASDVLDNEGLYDVSNYIKDKIDKIQSGENDEYIESTYTNYLNEDYDDVYDDEELFEVDENYDEDGFYENDY
ncbi:hypothetical protein [Proteiniborus sp.]|uniref:hypothetical protein n=1 Tax=Proteiniborus sp. TaxID=2079015 RepID=UPI003316C6AB